MLLPSDDNSVAPELRGRSTPGPQLFHPGTSHDITSTFIFFPKSVITASTLTTITGHNSTKGRKGEKRLTSSKAIKSKLLTTNGHFLPYRSAAIPNEIAPMERNMSTSVMPHVMSVVVLPNSSASSSTVRETVKKSKASHVCLRYG